MGDCKCAGEYETNAGDVDCITKIQEISLDQFSILRTEGHYVQENSREGIFYLFGRGEIFGFIKIFGNNLEKRSSEFFSTYSPLINAIMSDQAFSYRMHVISAPLEDPTRSLMFEQKLGKQITDLVTRGFGADGSTFRLTKGGTLEVVASAGKVTEKITQARRYGELLSGLLMESKEYDGRP